MRHEINSCDFRHLPYLLSSSEEILEVSYAFLDLVGYSKEEIIYNTLSELFLLLFKNNLDLNNIEEQDQENNYCLITKAFEIRQVNIIVRQGITKNNNYFLFIEKPNTRLEEKFPYIQQLYQDNVVGVAIFNLPDYVLLKANQQFLSFLSERYKKASNALGLKAENLFSNWNENTVKDLCAEVLKTGKSQRMREYPYIDSAGRRTHWTFTLTPISENREVKYIIVLLEDMTERVVNKESINKHVEKIAKQKEDLENILTKKDEFFSFISHEFKTPLTVISSAIQAMEVVCKNELSEKAKGYINKIRQNSLRQLRLVNNLLDFSKSESGFMKINKRNMDIVSLTKVITESISLYAKEKGIVVKFSTLFVKKIIAIDDEKYERILLNLLSNAIKFTPSGKYIHVKVSKRNRKVCIEVEDEGIGILKEKQEIIFERFGQVDNSLTRKTEGTGIGLSLVKLLVKAHEGEIAVHSEEGKGSTFTILLPAVKTLEGTLDGFKEITDNRLIQAIAIEFSDIYLK